MSARMECLAELVRGLAGHVANCKPKIRSGEKNVTLEKNEKGGKQENE